jgi:hypothetical protein
LTHYDFAIGWVWEYDEAFVQHLEAESQNRRGLTTYRITAQNIDDCLQLVRQNKLTFSVLLDRAFDADERFEELGRLLRKRRHCTLINDYDHTSFAIDKATMHLEFMQAGIYVPYSITISPFSLVKDINLTLDDLAHLGRPFIIKPANTTGGGLGVVTGAETLVDVLAARQELDQDKYLLQEKIIPRIIKGRRCWFRCFFVYGKVFLAWWDDQTHVYSFVTKDEEHYYKLSSLRGIMKKIAAVAKLNFFSSEIALRESTSYEPSRFVVVDYVNDMCDMRTEDIAHDGLPNGLEQRIVERLALCAEKLARA